MLFERVCFQHLPQLKNALGISGEVSNVCSRRTEKTDEHPGVQIDMLIVRGDNVVNLCEMKYYGGEYMITESDVKNFALKADVFKLVTGTKMSVHLTLVTSYGVADNAYSSSIQSFKKHSGTICLTTINDNTL